MKCPNCGTEVEVGELFCPVCATEIEIVEDFQSADSLFREAGEKENRLNKKKADKWEARQKENLRRRRQRKRLAIISFLMIFAVLCAIAIVLVINYNRDHSFDYQYARAESARLSGNAASAEGFIEKAMELDPSSKEAKRLYALILIDEDREEEAETLYREMIAEDPSSKEDYQALLDLLDREERPSDMKALLLSASDEIREAFAGYLPSEPEFLDEPGDLTECIRVRFKTVKGQTIYYTTDGTAPDTESQVYDGKGISTDYGRNEIRAIAVNSYGIRSSVTVGVFDISHPVPDAPVVSPVSGTYKKGQKITVVVPSGYTAYYCFDTLPGVGSKKYTEPVNMPTGTHIFSVVLRDKDGRSSAATSETYIVQE